jgi:hypothetical protein
VKGVALCLVFSTEDRAFSNVNIAGLAVMVRSWEVRSGDFASDDDELRFGNRYELCGVGAALFTVVKI